MASASAFREDLVVIVPRSHARVQRARDVRADTASPALHALRAEVPRPRARAG